MLALLALLTPGKSYPEVDGQVAVDGLDGPVTIHRDAYGVPHIRAETEHDLWFAIGFVHAQDRLWQMDLVRRLGSGRLSEWLGADAVPFDTFMQSLEMEERYARRLPDVDPDVLAAGQAYADGVNAGAASLPALPVEYRVLGVDFETWSVTDAMSASVINSWTLSENAPKEVITLLLRDRLDRQGVDDLWRWDPASPETDAYWDELRTWDIAPMDRPFIGLVEFLWGVHDPTASNNWAVDGSRSADGMPLLANDPHLPQMVPSVWYAVEGSGGDVHIAGASLAGTPFLATGHNERVAWGVTNVMADYVDLAIVEKVGQDRYLLAGEEKALRPVEVRVDVRNGETVEDIVWWTEVGPVISTLDGSHLIALRWSLFEVQDQTAPMWLAIQKSESVDDVVEAAARPSMIAQNLMAADVDGNIAWQVFGGIPRRKNHTGRVPYPASDPAHGWEGWVEDLPGRVNPPEGVLHTANARPDHPEAWNISTAFIPDWRDQRIREQLLARRDHTTETMSALQRDELDTHAPFLIPILLDGAELNRCGELLRDWDGTSGADRVEPLIWAIFQGELIEEALADDLGSQGLRLYTAAAISGRSVLDVDFTEWVEDPTTAVEAALSRTCDQVEADEVWGDRHRLHIRHLFSEQSAALDDWSMPEAPWGGSHNTVNQAGYSWFADELHATWIASIRVVTPLSDVGKATFTYPGGQSGMPGHSHYDDLYGPYLAGEALPLWFHDEDVEREAVDTLVLISR